MDTPPTFSSSTDKARFLVHELASNPTEVVALLVAHGGLEPIGVTRDGRPTYAITPPAREDQP